TAFKEAASTDFGKQFFGNRVESLTVLKNSMVDANDRVKHVGDLISSGQEVKQDVRDAVNQKLDSVNNLVTQAEKDYNETFVADFEKAVSTTEQLKNKAENVKEDAQQLRGKLNQEINKTNEILDNGREKYDKAVNDYSRLKTEL
ncbi:YhgE/Pip domain-containing protein, partial [Bacillus sp. B-TM1]